MITRDTYMRAPNKQKLLYLFDEIIELRDDVRGRKRIDRYVAILSGALGGLGAMLVVLGKITWESIVQLFT